MKLKGVKIILFIVIFSMILPLLGCDSTQDSQEPTGGGNIQGESAEDITFSNIDKYNDFIQTNYHAQDNFVTADMIKELGAFRMFICSGIDYSVYTYSIIHEDGHILWLKVNQPCYSETLPEISSSLLGPTMATITEDIRAIVSSNGLKYCYILGVLYAIEWTVNDTNFHLAVPFQHVKEMPTTLSEDSILRKLLSKDAEDQIAAYNQLVDMVTK